MRFPRATLRSEGSLPALQSLSLLQQSSKQGSHLVAKADLQPNLFRFNRAACSDASRGALGNVEDVLVTTLPRGRVQGIPVDFMGGLRGLQFPLKLRTEQ
jgi:hypothetical protein